MNTLASVHLASGYDKQIVIADLSVTLPKGKFTAIVGANGCGKSTLLKALSRLLKPISGNVLLDEADLHSLPSRTVARRISILLQSAHPPDALTVRELVSYGRYPHRSWLGGGSPDDESAIEWAMKVTAIDDMSNRPVSSLSGGQQQRVWIAMTLAQGAETLLLDEPTNHLDMSHQLDVMELLKTLNTKERKTIIIVMHDLNLASRYAEHMIVMHEGTILTQGTPDDVMTNQILKKAFRINAIISRDTVTGRPYCIPYPDEAISGH